MLIQRKLPEALHKHLQFCLLPGDGNLNYRCVPWGGNEHRTGSIKIYLFSSVQFSSVAQSCPTFCDLMNRSTPGLPVHHQLPEFTQTHVHLVSDAIQPYEARGTGLNFSRLKVRRSCTLEDYLKRQRTAFGEGILLSFSRGNTKDVFPEEILK